MAAITDKDVRVWLLNSARTVRYPLYGWRSMSVKNEKFGTANCTLSFGKGRPPYSALVGSTLGKEFLEASIDVFLWDMTTPLFSGPIIAPNFAHAGAAASSSVTLVAESFLGHFLRRRLSYTAAGAKMSITGKADDVIKSIIGKALGSVVPGSYPGGVSRNDYNSFVMTAAAATASHPTTITFDEQARGNVLDQCQRLCDQYDMALTISETSAATFQIGTAYPYQNSDKSASIILTPYRANMTGFEYDVDGAGLANVWLVAGQGKGATQVQSWASDATSVADRGVYEDSATSPDADAVTMGPADASWAVAKTKDPVISYKVPIRQNGTHRFNSDYKVRDLVGVYDPVFAKSTSQLVVGSEVQIQAGGRLAVTLDIKALAVDPLRTMAEQTGLPGGRTAGSRWKEKSSP